MKLRKRKVVAVQLQTAGIASIMPSLTVLAAMLPVDVHGGGGGQVLLVCSTAREQQRTRSDCILQQHRSRAQ